MMEDSQDINSCYFCNKVLSSKKNLRSHLVICKRNNNNNITPASKFSCICGTTFTRKNNLVRHHKKCALVSKGDSSCQMKGSSVSMKCHNDDCDERFQSFKDLIFHLKTVHNVVMKPIQYHGFSSETEFLNWKETEEAKTLSYYSKQTGNKRSVSYYHCQHDGSSKPHRKTTEQPRISSRKKHIGQIKRDSHCLARMIVRKDGSSLSVEYHSTHSHRLSTSDIAHQPASQSATLHIKKQIALNVPAMEIHRSLQSIDLERENRDQTQGSFSGSDRNLAITKKSIQLQISKIKKKSRHHENDSTSVFHLVNELKQEKYNSIILYKPLGMDIQVGPEGLNCLPSEMSNLFMIGIQTKEQMELMVKGARKILIVDDTHNITHYENTRLLNVMIVDEHNYGWPVAHFISNCLASNTIAYFVRAMDNVVSRAGGKFNINCLITDDDPALINGFESGLGVEIRHILCQWHLDRTLQKNIREKGDRINFQSIYDELKVIITTKNSNEFQQLYHAFLKKHAKDSESLVNYLQSHYSNRTEKWAMSSRVGIGHGNINTTSHVESFHNKLKTKYLHRVQNKRMDDIINILLQIEKDDFAARKRLNLLTPAMSHEAHKNRHAESLKITDEDMFNVSPLLWQMKSSQGNDYYFIEKSTDSCTADLCFDKCLELSCLGLCAHSYQCSCPDTHPLCKHVHKIHSFLRRGEAVSADINPVVTTDEVDLFQVPVITNDEDGERDIMCQEKLREKFTKTSERLLQTAQSKNLSSHLLQSGIVWMEQFLRRIEAEVEAPPKELDSFPKGKKINPREKLATQESQLLPFKRKKKRPASEGADSLSKMRRREEARDALILSCVEENDNIAV